MSQTIRRGGTSARASANAQGKARAARRARARTGSALDTLMGWIPLDADQLHRLFLALIFAAVLGLALLLGRVFGLGAIVQREVAHVASSAGFEVRRVEVRGVHHLNELKIYERALAEKDQAMPLVDLAELRGRLMELSWVEDARVSRQLPDTLVIDVIERKPVAVLRQDDQLSLIDIKGHVLEPVTAARAGHRLVVSGANAEHEVGALAALLNAAPAMKPQVAEAAWVGNRRWNLTFKTGQVLALPEGGAVAARALMTFARLDGVNRLLGGRVAAFDMRAPDRIYLRVPGRAEHPIAAMPTKAGGISPVAESDRPAAPERQN